MHQVRTNVIGYHGCQFVNMSEKHKPKPFCLTQIITILLDKGCIAFQPPCVTQNMGIFLQNSYEVLGSDYLN